MAGGYRAGAGDGLDTLIREFAKIKTRLAELERPDGTSIASLYDQVQAALANIDATVQASIMANSYTKSQIDNRILNPPTGDMTLQGNLSASGSVSAVNVSASGNVSAGGNLSATGTASAGGLATFNGGISSTDARNRVLTQGYAVGYWDATGRAGTVPSALRYKQDVEPADTAKEVEALRTVALVRYRYIAAVEELGDAAPYLLGSIAEYFVAAGLGEWVFFSEDGKPDGINYERLTIPLIAAFQSLDRRIRALESAA